MHPIIGNLSDLKRLVAIELRISDPVHQNLLLHCSRVSQLCRSFAEHAQLPQDRVDKLEVCGLLHDYSLKSFDPECLNSKVELTAAQWEKMVQHPIASAELALHLTGDPEISQWILHHHCSGSNLNRGYPASHCIELKSMAVELQILIACDHADSGLSGRWKDSKTAAAIAIEIENLGKRRAISLDVAHNFAKYLRKGLHEPFYH